MKNRYKKEEKTLNALRFKIFKLENNLKVLSGVRCELL